MNTRTIFLLTMVLCLAGTIADRLDASEVEKKWADLPFDQWPQIAMVNQITYTDKHHPIGGCAFLLDTGEDTLAVTAKHVLNYFKSERMNSVSFRNTLEIWKMFPKDNPDDVVVVGKLINEDADEPIDRVPAPVDWLLFEIEEKSPNIQPLRFRTKPLVAGEKVFIVGWRYSDKDCPQVIYEGAFERSEKGSILISTQKLSDNKIPGLSGSPVIDSDGRLIGLMSKKAGKLERPSSIEYPKEVLSKRKRTE